MNNPEIKRWAINQQMVVKAYQQAQTYGTGGAKDIGNRTTEIIPVVDLGDRDMPEGGSLYLVVLAYLTILGAAAGFVLRGWLS